MTSSIHKTLCVLAVHYNNEDEVRRYVNHVLDLSRPAGWRVVVSVTDNSLNWPPEAARNGEVWIWTPGENLGYLNGCAFALERLKASEEIEPDWVAVTNTDIKFDSDALLRLLETQWPETVGAVAPQIRTRIHRDQNPFMASRPSRTRLRLLQAAFKDAWWRRAVVWFLGSFAYRKWSRFKSRRGSKPTSTDEFTGTSVLEIQPQRIYAPHGSVIFLSRWFFNSGCRLDMPWTMYGEEIHIAEQIRRSGLDVIRVPEIRVEHRMASTTSSLDPDQQLEWRSRSLEQILSRYFTGPAGGSPVLSPRKEG